jgi:hypothetical protein
MLIPNLNGQKFKVNERFVQSGIHTFSSPQHKTYICKFKQKGRFVSSTDANKNECLGVWHQTINGWQLYISIDKNDNDTFVFTPTKLSENNEVIKMDGIIIESGTSKGGLLKVVNAIYDALPSNLKKNTSNIYNKINSQLRKNIHQNLGVAHVTCMRIGY